MEQKEKEKFKKELDQCLKDLDYTMGDENLHNYLIGKIEVLREIVEEEN